MSLLSLLQPSVIGLGSFSPGINNTKRNYTAAAFVKAGQLPAIGSTYENTVDGGIGTVVVSAENLPLVIKDLYKFNKALFFPKTSINGSKEETVNILEGQVYGDAIEDAPTGEITDAYVLTVRNYYQNIDGLNAMRKNPFGYDMVVFTSNTAEIFTAAEHTAQIMRIWDVADGSNTAARNGMIRCGYRGINGQVVPLENIYGSQLADDVRFVLTAGSGTNMTLGTCNGDYKRWSRTTTNTVSSIPFTADVNVACKTFSLYRIVNGKPQPSTGATYASIDSLTGTVTFPAGHTLGATKYIVVVKNEVGAWGEYKLEAIIA